MVWKNKSFFLNYFIFCISNVFKDTNYDADFDQPTVQPSELKSHFIVLLLCFLLLRKLHNCVFVHHVIWMVKVVSYSFGKFRFCRKLVTKDTMLTYVNLKRCHWSYSSQHSSWPHLEFDCRTYTLSWAEPSEIY